ncbi:MAG: hypothetical protein CSA23_06605 [Deltaproteobacteria bacterium]|nr:MAG: hypothetical protein CSA23_06605 [Deltaproteobacteria bacterium]
MKDNTVVIIRSSFSAYGGVEKVVLDVLDALIKNKVRVILLTSAPRSWPIAHPKLEIIPAGVGKGPRFLQAFLFNRGVTKFLKSQRQRPDCIFSFDRVMTFTHLHGGGGTHRTFLKLKNAESGFWSRQFRQASLFHNYTLYLEKKGFSNPLLKKIQCASSLVKQDIIRDYGVSREKLVLIPNSIDWPAIGEIFDHRHQIAATLADRHGLDPRRSYLLFLGSGFERKGLDLAIRGITGLPAHYRLLIVGKGHRQPYETLAKRLACDRRIHFLGPQPEGWKYAALCKALILPSRYEPFGVVCAEASAMGLPVLVSDRTGYVDWIQEGRNGVILRFPATCGTISEAFGRLLVMIESSPLAPEKIRGESRCLDHGRVMNRLISDFLGFD